MIYQNIVINFAETQLEASCIATLSQVPRMLLFSFLGDQDLSCVLRKSGGSTEMVFTYNEKEGQWDFPTWLVQEDKALESVKEFLVAHNLNKLPALE